MKFLTVLVMALLVTAGTKPGVKRSVSYGDTRVLQADATITDPCPTGDLSTVTAMNIWPHRAFQDPTAEPNQGTYTAAEEESLAAFQCVIFDLGRIWTGAGGTEMTDLRAINTNLVILGYHQLFYFDETRPTASGSGVGFTLTAMWDASAFGAAEPRFARSSTSGRRWPMYVVSAGDTLWEWNPVPKAGQFGDNGYTRKRLLAAADSLIAYGKAAWSGQVNGLNVDYIRPFPNATYFPTYNTDFDSTGFGVATGHDVDADSGPGATRAWVNTEAQRAFKKYQQDWLSVMRSKLGSGAILVANQSGDVAWDTHSDWLPLTNGIECEKCGYLNSNEEAQFLAVRSALLSATPAPTGRGVGWMMLSAERDDTFSPDLQGGSVTRVQQMRVESLLLGCWYIVYRESDAELVQDIGYFKAGQQVGSLIQQSLGGGATRWVRQYSQGWARIRFNSDDGDVDSVAFDTN